MSALGYWATYGSGSLSHTVSTSEMRTSRFHLVNICSSEIFSRPILWNVDDPHPKSSKESPEDMPNAGTPSSRSTSNSSSSIAPTRNDSHPVFLM